MWGELAAMGAFQNIIDSLPAPKLLPIGDLDPAKATLVELRGEAHYRSKGKRASCHPGAHMTDDLSHDLQVERPFEGRAEGIA